MREFLFCRSRDVNAPPPPVYLARPDAALGQVRQIESTGRQTVHSVQILARGRLTKRFNGNVELLFPLPGTGKDKAFRGFVFGDFGGVYGEGVPISVGQRFRSVDQTVSGADANGTITTTTTPVSRLVGSGIKYSIGFGINWLSPLGALKLSYGIPLKVKPEDKVKRLQFNIGNNF